MGRRKLPVKISLEHCEPRYCLGRGWLVQCFGCNGRLLFTTPICRSQKSAMRAARRVYNVSARK